MVLAFLSWYGLFLLVGWLGFPIAYRFLPFLPGRGFALSKALGLLIWAFGFWVAVSLHVVQNDAGGILLSLLALALIAGLSLRSGMQEMAAWVRNHGRLILISEGLFFALFGFWTVVRAAAPEAVGTEKPMELAFIQAILRSPSFPPHDPWLSGYAISYYYFGYVMVAMLSKFTGVAGEVGFNLAIAGWFGLAGVASYGVLYELLASGANSGMRKAAVQAFLAPLFILLISNLNGPLEMFHARGVFWQRSPSGELQSSFWRWLDIQELNRPPAEPFSWAPNRPGGIWWWRSSRRARIPMSARPRSPALRPRASKRNSATAGTSSARPTASASRLWRTPVSTSPAWRYSSSACSASAGCTRTTRRSICAPTR
uniref:Uncharacterized protein n=1 Tax=Anaerolinea thermolimosa TaxID=229919 RepID=A0A7C4KH22_9CHLR